jgi:hypothetical protein
MTRSTADDRSMQIPDAFMSHSSRDKALFVRPLVECLDEQGLRIWYDEYSMQPGDSLSASIDAGLSRARSGLVVISPSFIETARASGWTHYELRGIVSNSIGPQGRRIIPVWLDVTREEVLEWSPPMADLVAVDASGKSIEEVALALLRVLAPGRTSGLARMRLLATARGNGHLEAARVESLKITPAEDRRVPGSVPLRALLVTLAMADCGVDHAADFATFLENLSRDLHHERELRLWEAIAATYASATQTFETDDRGKTALYRLLLSASFGMADREAINTLTPQVAGPVIEYFQQLRAAIHGDAVIGAGGLKGYIDEPSANEVDREESSGDGHSKEES